MLPLRIFIGYDPKESVAYHVLSHSILRRSSIPVSITPIALQHLKEVFTRPRGPGESTEFSMTRFLTPYLAGYNGLSVYMDCDMLCLSDISSMMDLVLQDKNRVVWVAQHPNYTPKQGFKMDGQKQSAYPRKNWSSLIVFNSSMCRELTAEEVNTRSPAWLHRFMWISDHEHIGSLPLAWNWLVGEYDKNLPAKILHYTNGGPWMEGYENCDYADEWLDEAKTALLSSYRKSDIRL